MLGLLLLVEPQFALERARRPRRRARAGACRRSVACSRCRRAAAAAARARNSAREKSPRSRERRERRRVRPAQRAIEVGRSSRPARAARATSATGWPGRRRRVRSPRALRRTPRGELGRVLLGRRRSRALAGAARRVELPITSRSARTCSCSAALQHRRFPRATVTSPLRRSRSTAPCMRQATARGSCERGRRSVGSISAASSYPRYRNQPPENGESLGRDWRHLPVAGSPECRTPGVERVEEALAARDGASPARRTVGLLHEPRAGQREQEVRAAERLGAAHALEQDRDSGRESARAARAGRRRSGPPRRPQAQVSARKTRLPLVPPKPNEFDSATRTGAWRAVSGT